MKKSWRIFLLLGFFILFSQAHSEVFLEPYGGVLFGPLHLSSVKTKNTYDQENLTGSFDFDHSSHFKPNFSGGMRVGSWFGCEDSDSWKKYLGCYGDATYDSLHTHFYRSLIPVHYTENSFGPAEGTTEAQFLSKGHALTAAVLLSVRGTVGWFQPYLALGPALFVVRQESTLVVEPHSADSSTLSVLVLTERKIKTKKTARAPALVVDAGFQWSVSKHVFLDTFFKYRFAKPNFHGEMTLHPTFNLCGCYLGAGYKF